MSDEMLLLTVAGIWLIIGLVLGMWIGLRYARAETERRMRSTLKRLASHLDAMKKEAHDD